MRLKLAANISFMFQEISSLAGRYAAVKKAGFQFVELAFPYGEPKETIKAAKEDSGLEQVLINAYPGNVVNGDLGIAALPDRIDEFRETLEMSIDYANALQCKRMHVMAGKIPTGTKDEGLTKMLATFKDNIKYAADRLQKEGILALIEPVNNKISAPGYFLHSPAQGLDIVKEINHPNLRLQFDIFHVQIMAGNLTTNIKEYLPYIGHIQIAQVPDRHEPDSPGEINYRYVFNLLESEGYDGFIGLEYKPKGKTEDGLGWFKEFSS